MNCGFVSNKFLDKGIMLPAVHNLSEKLEGAVAMLLKHFAIFETFGSPFDYNFTCFTHRCLRKYLWVQVHLFLLSISMNFHRFQFPMPILYSLIAIHFEIPDNSN